MVFADGRTIWGQGFGAEGEAVGELCFNTAMTGYQEVMTDPSYAKQVIAFTFPHIGNVGANDEDVEAVEAHALGAIVREPVTAPSNYRSTEDFGAWMEQARADRDQRVDTRALTRLVREEGPPTIAIAHSEAGEFDLEALQRWRRSGRGWRAWTWPRRSAGCRSSAGPAGSGRGGGVCRGAPLDSLGTNGAGSGRKRRPLPSEVEASAPTSSRSTMAPSATSSAACARRGRGYGRSGGASFDEIMAHEPDGFFLSNGPGDPAATGEYAIPVIRQMLETGKPLFGICLGHQLLALAVGGRRQRCSRATAAPTTRSRGWRTGGSRSPA